MITFSFGESTLGANGQAKGIAPQRLRDKKNKLSRTS
jgi:hypothetical protein